jgi:hypothetical protein
MVVFGFLVAASLVVLPGAGAIALPRPFSDPEAREYVAP